VGGGPALFVGGDLSEAGQPPVDGNNVFKWDGTSYIASWRWREQHVFAIAEYDDGAGPAVYVSGYFTGTFNHVARWNGQSWSALGSGLSHTANCFAVYDDGGGPALYAGGVFTTAGGAPAGKFETAGGVAVQHIARWNGTAWSAVGSGLVEAGVLVVHDDGGGAGPALYATHGELLARWACTDWTPPTPTCPTRVFAVDRTGSVPGEVVTFEVAATDDQDPSPVVECRPESGSHFSARHDHRDVHGQGRSGQPSDVPVLGDRRDGDSDSQTLTTRAS
jgi:hypothetical protein